MTKRMAMDAIIVLRNAGYVVKEIPGRHWTKPLGIIVYTGNESDPATWMEVERLSINGGCIANAPIEDLLNRAA